MKTRGFECVSYYLDKEINLPKRATHHAAGYDFEAAEDIIIPTIWKTIFKAVALELKQWIHPSIKKSNDMDIKLVEKAIKPILVPTGIKAYMQENEYLQLTNRSSNPLKNYLILPNGVGIVDADYYNNSDNEGQIYFQLLNFGIVDKKIKKGDRIGQGIFQSFLLSDDDVTVSQRTGGFGSSGKDAL